MNSKDENNLFDKKYYGKLEPNTEEANLFYEKDLNLKTEDLISYKYNNEGFRCDDFSKEKNGLHVLFAGCSETEGAANKIEDVWAYVLYNKIKENHPIAGYYNVGKSGLTVSGIIMNVFQYIYDYGYPDYIFLHLPDQTRYISWNEENSYHPKYKVPEEQIDQYGKDLYFKNHDNLPVMKINLLYNYFLLKVLIQVCELNNTKLIWSTWHTDTVRWLIPELKNLNGYIDSGQDTKDAWDIKLNELKARDGWHFGKGFHKLWARKFYEAFLNDKNN